jgi:hypothetical protein
MILKPCMLSSSLFSYHGDTQTFTAEVSTLCIGRGTDYGRVYDDACDYGFTIVSRRTGKEVVFAHDHDDRDREGDLAGEWFVAVTPGYTHLKALVIND